MEPTVTETPDRVATTIIDETPHSWVVACEGCGARCNVPKHVTTHDGVETMYTAPGAVRCIGCGPFDGVVIIR